MIPEGHLLEEVVWRLEVLTPLHAGSGEQLTKGLDVESAEGWTFAVDMENLLRELPPGRWSSVGTVDLAQLYPGGSLRKVQRYAVHGSVHGPPFGANHAGTKLRCFARDAFGRPYLPGSTLKGALRTALLMQIAETDGAVQDALGAAARQREARDGNGKDIDARTQRAAFRIGGSDRVVDDVLRHLHVPDVPIPPSAVEVVDVRTGCMDADNGWAEKPWATFVEAVRAETVLRVPLRVAARQLGRTEEQDFSQWEKHLLGDGLLAAARAHGDRILGPEVTLWTRSRPGPAAGLATSALAARATEGDAVFPVGWGIGWRGMTGAALERLDGPGPRAGDANAEDPKLLAVARKNHPTMAGRSLAIFPKSRRLAVKGSDPALPMGWVAARAWQDGDQATPFDPVTPPEGKLPRPAHTASAQRTAHRTPAAPVVTTGAKRGDKVTCRLVGKNKNEKWKVRVLKHEKDGVVVGGDEPAEAAVGKEIELEVKNTAVGGQSWDLEWPKKG
jgi:hypothetical protein